MIKNQKDLVKFEDFGIHINREILRQRREERLRFLEKIQRKLVY